jgi:hypothetical protein
MICPVHVITESLYAQTFDPPVSDVFIVTLMINRKAFR